MIDLVKNDFAYQPKYKAFPIFSDQGEIVDYFFIDAVEVPKISPMSYALLKQREENFLEWSNDPEKKNPAPLDVGIFAKMGEGWVLIEENIDYEDVKKVGKEILSEMPFVDLLRLK